MAKRHLITAYTLTPGESDDGTKPVIHVFTPDEAEKLQAYVEQHKSLPSALATRLATALAHATVIYIGELL